MAGDLILEPARRIAQEKAWNLPAKDCCIFGINSRIFMYKV